MFSGWKTVHVKTSKTDNKAKVHKLKQLKAERKKELSLLSFVIVARWEAVITKQIC